MKRPSGKSATKPLCGVRVLVGRARHQASALSSGLRELGAQVIEIPFIEIRRPRSFKSLDSAIKNIETYDWLILTSVNGVEALWKRWNRTDINSAGNQIRIAAIGPATKKAIEDRGLKVNVVPKEYVAESVVRSLRNKVKGKRVLLVRAKVARDVIPHELQRAGAKVDVVEAYETVVPRTSRLRLRSLFRQETKRPHIVTFTSSSTVKNFVELIGQRSPEELRKLLNRTLMASIGPITSSTLREYGLPIDIAANQFTIPDLVSAIVRGIKSRKFNS
jgi:uroporphyrinogen-III synthase